MLDVEVAVWCCVTDTEKVEVPEVDSVNDSVSEDETTPVSVILSVLVLVTVT